MLYFGLTKCFDIFFRQNTTIKFFMTPFKNKTIVKQVGQITRNSTKHFAVSEKVCTNPISYAKEEAIICLFSRRLLAY